MGNKGKKLKYARKWRDKLDGVDRGMLISIIRECYKRIDKLEETLQSVNDKLKADTDNKF